MKTIKSILSLFAIILIAGTLRAQNTVPDSLFGINSKIVLQTIGGEVGGNFMLQPDGKIIYGGYDVGQFDFQIDMMRFDECGEIDSSFGTNGQVRHKFSDRNLGLAYALQPDGKIVCAGVQAPSNSGSQQRACVSRFNSDGSVDNTFNLTGTHPIMIAAGRFHSVYVDADNKIVCFGQFGSGLGGGIVRFLSDGSLDTTFNTDGIALFRPAGFSFFSDTKGHLLPDGKFLMTSYASDANNVYHILAVRLDTAGVADTTYGTDGYYYDTLVPVNGFFHPFNSVVDANGNLLLSKSSDNTSFDILRLTPEGKPDITFGAGGHVHYNFDGTAGGIDVMADGKILVRAKLRIGNFGIGGGIRFLPDGTPDETFGPNGLRQFNLNNDSGTHWLDALLVLPNGKWIAAGASDGFLFKKYVDVSNFPHITQAIGVLNSTGTGDHEWYLDGQPILSATQNSYAFTQNGDYSVKITDAIGCTGMSSVFSVINVGINSIRNNSEISVYPNPSKGLYYFKGFSDLNKSAKVEVKNSIGQTVVVETGFKLEETLNLINSLPGIYYIRITDNLKSTTFKVIKQ